MTVRDALEATADTVSRRDAETLLLAILQKDRAWLFAHADATLDEEQATEFQHLCERRAAHEPLQYLTGRQEFYGLDLQVTPATLIPRPETEQLVELVVAWCRAHQRTAAHVLDVGTGTGAIALACAAQLTEAAIVACDVSEEALQVARQNAARLGMGARIAFLQSDLLASVPTMPPFDVVVSNPPYVPSGDAATMQPEVVKHEPHLALFAGHDGLAVYRRLIPQAHAALRNGGLLAMEFGYGQREALGALLAAGWHHVRFFEDYAGIPRVVLAERISSGG